MIIVISGLVIDWRIKIDAIKIKSLNSIDEYSVKNGFDVMIGEQS
jgi:hypothetical protein